jgi:hypothetical protein
LKAQEAATRKPADVPVADGPVADDEEAAPAASELPEAT